MKRVRAIIIKNNKILLIKRIKKGRTYWVFPGGLVESGETDIQALKREVKEELGIEGKVGKLFHQIKSEKPETKGQIENFYLCHYLVGQVGTGQGPEYQPDSDYVGTHEPQWVNLSDIKNMKLLPKEVRNLIIENYQ